MGKTKRGNQKKYVHIYNLYTSLRKQYRQTQILLPQAKAQDATQGLLAPQDAKTRGGMEASPAAARKTQSYMRDANWSDPIRRAETKHKKEQVWLFGFFPRVIDSF